MGKKKGGRSTSSLKRKSRRVAEELCECPSMSVYVLGISIGENIGPPRNGEESN